MNNFIDKSFIFAILAILFIFVSNAPVASQSQIGKYSVESLFIALLPDGNALVVYDLAVDPNSSETSIKLHGQTINDLILEDYNEHLVPYVAGEQQNDLKINTRGVSNFTVTYGTPDLVNKAGKNWTFSLDATTEVLLKLPSNARVIDWGNQFPTIRQVGEQDLLTFQPGKIHLIYTIGIATQDQANLAIKVAGITIKDIKSKNPDIILSQAEDLLKNAVTARDNKRYGDAEKFATGSNNLAGTIQKNYTLAQSTITSAENRIHQAEQTGNDVHSSRDILAQARQKFLEGNYVSAISLANEAISKIGERTDSSSNETVILMIASVVIISAASAASIIIYRKKKRINEYSQGFKITKQNSSQESSNIGSSILPPASSSTFHAKKQDADPVHTGNKSNLNSSAEAKASPISFRSNLEDIQQITGQSIDPDKNVNSNNNPLLSIVVRILEDKPYLRPEDQQVLRFLAEKEGAAFESEVRNKFQLPKTTVWRLIKRLEREDIVEIRKAGGQNLIKLRYEDRQI